MTPNFIHDLKARLERLFRRWRGGKSSGMDEGARFSLRGATEDSWFDYERYYWGPGPGHWY